jgi:PleD family two-component response regulator
VNNPNVADETFGREARVGAAATRTETDPAAYEAADRNAAMPAEPYTWRSRTVAAGLSPTAVFDEPLRILMAAEPDLLDEGFVSHLRDVGHLVVTVGSGGTALAALDRDQFDLVILDVVLRGMPGFDTCMEIRERSEVPVIFLTSVSSLQERLLGFDSGADDYVVRPVTSQELERRIRAVVRRGRPRARVEDELTGPGGLAVRV